MKRTVAWILAWSLLASGIPILAQNSATSPFPLVRQQFFDAAGKPLASGEIYLCQSGQSCPGTTQTTYSDAAGTTANANPVVLDVAGVPSSGGIFLSNACYKIVGRNVLHATQWTMDKICDPGLLHQTQLLTQNLNNLRMCDQFTGATAGAKIIACIADLPSTGGIADARGIEGDSTITSNLTVGDNKTLLLGGGTYTLSNATIILGNNSHVRGLGTNSNNATVTLIKKTTGTASMITATGTGAAHVRGFSIEDLYIDGGSTASHGIVLSYVDTFTIHNVQVRHGAGAVNALRILNEAWDFWITNSFFVGWGDATNPNVDLVASANAITDGHWISDVIGDIEPTYGTPSLHANNLVLQQRFFDVKFHRSGAGMTHKVDWAGYRSDFIGCTFQSSEAASLYMMKITGPDNRVIGGEFTDVNIGDAIQLDGTGGLLLEGVTFRSNSAPGPGSAVNIASGAWAGQLVAVGNQFIQLTAGLNINTGVGTVTLGPNQSIGTTTPLVTSASSVTWTDYDAGKMTATFAGANVPTTRSAGTLNPVLSLGGNTATNSAGYQGLFVMPKFLGGGQINESIGLSTTWAAGVGSVTGTNIEHPITWCYVADTSCFEVYTKAGGTPVAGGGKIFGVNVNGSLILTNTGFAGLGTPANGTVAYCADCANASNPCAGAGTGAIAKRLNGAWDCR